MLFESTRNPALAVGFAEALLQGLAADGGLFVPRQWPQFTAAELAQHVGLPPDRYLAPAGLARVAAVLLAPFAEGSALGPALPRIAAEALDFPAPLVPLASGPGGSLAVLELFHGPTAAFKDFGARFLAACLSRLRPAGARPLSILVATSGDTGGAVAAAFHRRPGIEVVVLFPQGLVSRAQQQQLTCWGDNVRSFAVRGTFDDCQRLVKAAFLDPALRQRFELSSANSINLGRLLPQAVYYAAASLCTWQATGEPASFIVPSGNLGNSVAALWARRMGAPVGQVVLAHNANREVPDFLASGRWEARASIPTLASAMDVGDPSNLERLRSLYPGLADLRAAISACSVDDAHIRTRIRADFARWGRIWCPHTATAAEAYERLSPERRHGHWVLVSTAHPAKFREIVEPLVGSVPVPQSLAQLYGRESRYTQVEPELAALRARLEGPAG